MIQQMQLDLCVAIDSEQHMTLSLDIMIDPGRRQDSTREHLHRMQDAVVSQDPTALFLARLEAHTGDVYVKRDPVIVPSRLVTARQRSGRALDLEEGS